MMIRMQMDYNMNFWEHDSLNVFQIFKFGSEFFEILQKYSCNTKFLQELLFIIYLGFIKFVFDKFSEHFLHLKTILGKCTVTLLPALRYVIKLFSAD